MTAEPTTRSTAHTALLTPRVEDLARSWQRQRLIRLGELCGWFRYLGGDARRGRYALALHDGTRDGLLRMLHRDTYARPRGDQTYRRDEPVAWITGLAYGHDDPGMLDGIGAMPRLYDLDQACEVLGKTAATIKASTRRGLITALHYSQQRRAYYADQIDALAGSRTGAQRWEKLRHQLPSTVRLEQVTLTEAPPPKPLPVPPISPDHGGQRNLNALHLAERFGWLEFISANRQQYTVTVCGHTLDVPALAVLPFVWGLGDARGEGDRVAYR
jgi:hypothetical protein